MIRTVMPDTVPDTWVFEHYCNLSEKLHGQDLKIRSVFNIQEKTPSMCIYYTGTKYEFKDFSSGTQGDGINLVQKLYGIGFASAKAKIDTDYNLRSNVDYEEIAMEKAAKFTVTSHMKRKWNEFDVKFWPQFGVGSKMLEKYNVYPLQQYTLSKADGTGIKEIVVSGNYLYGYFTNSGELYKVYQPFRKTRFFNVKNYIQGGDQLTYSQPLLIISSSLKDVMALEGLGFNAESVAPSSENTMIAKSILSSYALKYKKIITFFDNDSPGHLAMNKYEERYGIRGIFLRMSKDLSDSIRDYGANKTKQYLTPLIPTV